MDYGIDRPAELAVEATARPAAKNYTLGDGLFALFCLAAGYMGVRWYFFGSYGIGTTLLFFTLGVGISVYLRGKGCALSRAYWAGILLLLGFGTVFSLFRPSFVTFCTAVFLLLLLTLWAYRTAMDDGKGLIRRHWPADQARAFLVMPFASFGAAAGSFGGLFRRVPAGKQTKRVALGLLIAIPVTAATGVLLFQADAAFAGLLTTVWDTLFGGFELNIFRSVMRAALAVPGAFLLFSAVYSGRSRCCPTAFTDEGMDETRRQLRVMPRTVAVAAMTPVCLLYLVYFASQSAYFLSAFQNLLPAGYTYADYARRGFFELCGVAVLNLTLIALLQLFSRRDADTGKKPAAVRVYTVILAVFTLALIVTALRKMLLYIDGYGLTALRVYTSWFMVLLGMVFLLVIASQLATRLHLARGIGAAFILLFALLNFADVDARMAAYNVEHYRSGDLETIDVAHLRGLSEAAVPAAYPLLRDQDAEVARQVRQWYRELETELENRPPMEWSLASYRAEKAIRLARRDHLLADGTEILPPAAGDRPVDEIDIWQAEVGFQQGVDDKRA